MPTTCTFRLNKLNDPFYSGEAVNGSICLNLTSAESVKYLYIVLKGDGKVSWSNDQAETKKSDTSCLDSLAYKSNEIYVEKRQILSSHCDLEPGEYTFTFCLLLPMNCPSTFRGTFGTISYNLSVILSAREYDKEYNHAVNVVRKDDLNLNPLHRIPLQAETVAIFSCCACTTGRLVLTLNIPHGAFVPRQRLPYTLHIENESLSDVMGYSVKLMQDIVYTVRTPQHKAQPEFNEVYSEHCSNLCPRQTACSFQHNLIIPAVTPTTERRSIIRIGYNLKIFLEISRCAKNVEICAPIHIGTVLLVESEATIDPQGPTTMKTEDTSHGPPNYQNFKPPSFEEAIFSSDTPVEKTT